MPKPQITLSIRLTPERYDKLVSLAGKMECSVNQAIGYMVDRADLTKSKPIRVEAVQ